MSKPLFLITGASGDTGRYAALTLRNQGAAVRALVHQMDDRASALQREDIEVVQGDLLNLDDARRALDGVTAAYFVYPIRPGLMDATAFFAQAAKEAGIGALVNMSQISARREAVSNAARTHWVAERLFDWFGISTTHLKPTFFSQWLTYPMVVRTIKEKGLLPLPFGTGVHAPIAAEDQGRVIAAILSNPTTHGGKVLPTTWTRADGPRGDCRHPVFRDRLQSDLCTDSNRRFPPAPAADTRHPSVLCAAYLCCGSGLSGRRVRRNK